MTDPTWLATVNEELGPMIDEALRKANYNPELALALISQRIHNDPEFEKWVLRVYVRQLINEVADEREASEEK